MSLMKKFPLTANQATFVLKILFLSLLICGSVSAQTGTSSVRGTVTDSQGRAVAGATVTLANAERNFTRTLTTKEDGGYVFSAIPPGTYRIEAEASGFKKVAVSDVSALVDTPIDVSVRFEVGNVTETLNVSASTEAPINTTDASIGNSFESRRLIELPLNARNIVGLLSLQPGVTRQGEVNGGRRDQANITLDGVDVNEQQTGLDIVNPSGTTVPGNAFSSVIRVNPDSVQEFRVTTSVPNATQGRSSGAQVSLVTRSGTNEFHGSLYEFHRNTVGTANDWFNNAAGRYVATDPQVISGQAQVGDEKLKRPKLIRNVFGGSFGGPIIKDRAFFFYSYEGRRDAAEQSVLRNVPTATLRQGIVKYQNQSGGVTTLTPADIRSIYPETGGINPAALAILQTAPLPNDFSTGDGGLNRAGFRFNAPISTKLSSHLLKFDLNITDKQTLFVRGNYQNDLFGQAPNFPGTPSPALWVHPTGYAVGHNWTISNSLVNTARVGLTRASFSQQGDLSGTAVSFRDVYSPLLNTTTLSRNTPVVNVTDDVSWVKGTHTIQFGPNFRFIRNNRVSFANSFDNAQVNFQFYENGGNVLLTPTPIASTLLSSFSFDYGRAVAAALGRFTQYSINIVYDKSGKALPVGTPSGRSFGTEEYDFYGQDSWKIRPNLTLNYGLRWGVNTPVYEREGFQLVPNVNLSQFFEQRQASAAAGRPLNDPISFDLGGKANNKPGFYDIDKNNFAPLVSVAWSPDFGDNFFGRTFGRNGRSVIRGGFRMLYDRVGSQLAVSSEAENSFGFSSSATNGANATNATTRLGPLVSLNPDVRSFPRITAPANLTFPLTLPSDQTDRILAGIDQSVISPVQYTWNVSYGRELPHGLSFEFSYVGRAARNLIVVRDIMQPNNLVDSKSGMDWYTAARMLHDLRNANTPIASVGAIPYFENLFPGLAGPRTILGVPTTLTASQAAYRLHAKTAVGGANDTDFTDIQFRIDDAGIFPNAFFHPQYAALQTFSTVGRSDYHGGTLTIRQRFKNDVFFDFNYTLSKSMDNGSTLETLRALSNVLRNSFDPDLQYSVSNFDIRHSFNANWLVALPFGHGKKFLSNLHPAANVLLGGWQMAGIMRYSTGTPTGSPADVQWATNWQSTSWGVRLQPVSSSPTANVADSTGVQRPNLFSDPLAVYRSFRNALAGEAGDRNITTIRLPAYFVLDASLSKTFQMPYAERHQLQFRWEVFNVTNTQPFGAISTLSLNPDPFNATAQPAAFGRFTGSQTPVGESRPGRLMQFALRYSF
ncbi:MAG TPA: TonB-dependent receptor [Blastocatellia bacterium]|nr:TonB-dependent receptor [Blastocatellia bacterium]